MSVSQRLLGGMPEEPDHSHPGRRAGTELSLPGVQAILRARHSRGGADCRGPAEATDSTPEADVTDGWIGLVNRLDLTLRQLASVLALAALDVWVCCSQQGQRILLPAGSGASCAAGHSATDVANDSFRNGKGSYSAHLFSLVVKTTQVKLRRNAMASACLGKVASIFAPVLNRI